MERGCIERVCMVGIGACMDVQLPVERGGRRVWVEIVRERVGWDGYWVSDDVHWKVFCEGIS